ncbi:(2Fe-2S)-binding protein [Glaciimonas sp. GG7]
MLEPIELLIDNRAITVSPGTSVAAAIAMAGTDMATGITRQSVSGMLRAPVCGMGVCQECRVTIDGLAHRLACQTLCRAQMQVKTGLAKATATTAGDGV